MSKTCIPETSECPETLRAPQWKRASTALLVWILFTSIAVLFQWEEGAYRSEFGGHPDEAAHYVTGLLARDSVVFAKDYAFHRLPGSPIKAGKEFVQGYYDHYPKIGLGVWPPLFYIVQSAWTLPFGVSRESVLLLMGCLSGLVGTVLFSVLRREFGIGLAVTGGLLWLGLPLVQQYDGMVMAEMLSALTMFSATLYFGRYLDERRFRDAILFALFASAAILTKGTGLALVFVPPIAILVTGRYFLLKEGALWIAGGIVLVLAGPWTFATRKLGEGGWEEPHPSLHFTIHALPYYGWKVLVAVGILLAGLALVGLVAWVVSACRRVRDGSIGKWGGCLGLFFGVLVFQSIAPAGREARHIIPLLPAVLMFVVAGLAWLRQRIDPRLVHGSVGCMVGGVALLGFYGAPMLSPNTGSGFGSIGDTLRISPFKFCNKDSRGFGAVAARLMSLDSKGKPGVFLVSSDATGEGMFIAEVAMREDRRPAHVAHRASKELAASAWGGGGYKPKFESDEAMLAWLTSGAVDFVVVDTAVPKRNLRPHHVMLQRVIAAHPEQFEKVASEALFRGGVPMPGVVQGYRVRR